MIRRKLIPKAVRVMITLTAFVFANLLCFSQGRNHTWLLGYNTALDSYTTSTKARLIFDSSSVSIFPESRKMSFWQTQANISDENGNLLIASNGCWIANANGDTMLNGGGINPGLFTDDNCYDPTLGLPLSHGDVILPYPGDTTKYVLFHQTGNYDANLASTELYYSVIDMTLDGGLGGVTLKNQIAFQDTLSWGIAACKHANGRDWWIIAIKDSSNKIYKILFTSSGIASVTTQLVPFPLPYFGNACQPVFSPDGSKFAYTSGVGGSTPFMDCRIFSFDRCSGNLDTLAYLKDSNEIGFGSAFSPSSKYLYFSSLGRVYQVNTDTSNIIASLDTVAVWDGTYSPVPPFGTYFWYMNLTANGKIYLSTGGTVDIGYIDSPDSADTLCNVQQHALHLPCYSARADLNQPNYYLGCDTTSGCPCLNTGLNDVAGHDFHFKIFPNPVFDQHLQIIYLLPQNKNGTFEIFDVNGRKVFSYHLPPWSTLQNFSLPKLSNGLYECVITSGNERSSKKIAVIKE